MNPAPLRVVFMGTPALAVPSLRALAADLAFDVVEVWTQPDRPAGRGQQLTSSAVKVAADELGIPVVRPATITPVEIDRLRDLAPDFLVVVAYGLILPVDLLNIPTYGAINLHGSLLPKYRGASPIQSAILAGDTETGVSYMQIIPALDAGPVFAQFKTPIGTKTAGDLFAELAELGAAHFPTVLQKIAAGELSPEPQDDTQATHCGKITKADGKIDWQADAAKMLERKLRAYMPWPGLFSFLSGKRLKILDFSVTTGGTAVPGEIFMKDELVCVATADGSAIALRKVQPEGKQSISAIDWMHGDDSIAHARFD